MSMLSPQPNIKTHNSTPDPNSLPNSSILPTTESTELPTPLTTSHLPSATLFTFLPELYLIISRLAELRTPPVDLNGNSQSHLHTQSQSNSNANADLTLSISNESTTASATTTNGSSPLTPISVRDLPAHIFPVKKAIAAAREVVRTLPDIERSLEEQETELEELRREVGGLRRRVGKLGGIAKRGRRESGNETGEDDGDLVMQGTE